MSKHKIYLVVTDWKGEFSIDVTADWAEAIYKWASQQKEEFDRMFHDLGDDEHWDREDMDYDTATDIKVSLTLFSTSVDAFRLLNEAMIYEDCSIIREHSEIWLGDNRIYIEEHEIEI